MSSIVRRVILGEKYVYKLRGVKYFREIAEWEI